MLNAVIGTLTLLLAGNALGAVWAILALADPWHAPWMALLVPLLLHALLRFNQHPPGWWRRVLGVCGLWVAVLQCAFIAGGAIVAAHMGKPLWPWLFRIGPEMALAAAGARVGWPEAVAVLLGSLLAWWLGGRGLRPVRRRRAAT